MNDDYLILPRSDVVSLVLDAMEWAGQFAREGPPAESIVTALRSSDLASVAALVFPAQSGSNLETARVRIHDFVQLCKSLTESRNRRTLFRISDAEQETNRAQSLLLFVPAWSLFDGAANPVSDGFIDDEYFPPWDTWLTMIPCSGGQGNGLLTWVPEWASPLVNGAIQVDPANCLCWVRSEDDRLKEHEWGKPWPDAG